MTTSFSNLSLDAPRRKLKISKLTLLQRCCECFRLDHHPIRYQTIMNQYVSCFHESEENDGASSIFDAAFFHSNYLIKDRIPFGSLLLGVFTCSA